MKNSEPESNLLPRPQDENYNDLFIVGEAQAYEFLLDMTRTRKLAGLKYMLDTGLIRYVVVANMTYLDECVAFGIKPSQLLLGSEIQPKGYELSEIWVDEAVEISEAWIKSRKRYE